MSNPPSTAKLIARSLVACLVFSGVAAASAAPDDNRLKNPGGEEVSKDDKSLPAAWFAARVPAEGLTMRLDDKVVKAGRASMFVGNTFAYPQATFNNWAQRIEGLAAGESFTLSGWVKTENAETVSMCVQAWDEDGKNIVAFATTDAIIGTRDWQLVKSQPITIPASAKIVIVRAGVGGKGKAWFDDLRLAPGEGARFPQPPAEPGANLVANPGAEDVDAKDKAATAIWFNAHVPADGLVMNRVTDGAHTGKASLHIGNTHDYGQMVCNNWTQTIPYDLGGKTVKLSAWVKTESVESVNICVQGFTDLVHMASFGSTEVIKGTQDWTRVETKPIGLAKGVSMTTVRAVLTGKGKVWFDDITLEVVDGQPAPE